MKALRKQPGEIWEDVIARRAYAVGYGDDDVEIMLLRFVGEEVRPKADTAWDVAKAYGLLETIDAAEPEVEHA